MEDKNMDKKENKSIEEVIGNFLNDIKDLILNDKECPIELKIADEVKKLEDIVIDDLLENEYPDKVLNCILVNIQKLRCSIEITLKKYKVKESTTSDEDIPLF